MNAFALCRLDRLAQRSMSLKAARERPQITAFFERLRSR